MFGVSTLTLTHCLAKMKFPQVMGVLTMLLEIPEGSGGYFLVQESGNSGEVEGSASNSLCGGGMDIFWNYM